MTDTYSSSPNMVLVFLFIAIGWFVADTAELYFMRSEIKESNDTMLINMTADNDVQSDILAGLKNCYETESNFSHCVRQVVYNSSDDVENKKRLREAYEMFKREGRSVYLYFN